MQQDTLFPEMETTAEALPLEGRSVCMLGSFGLPAREIMKRLTKLGADCRPALKMSRNVHYVLVGRGAPTDQMEYLDALAFHGYRPRVLEEPDLMRLLAGHVKEYVVPRQIEKHLQLTWQHHLQNHLQLTAGTNSLYTKELFVPATVAARHPLLLTRLGERGVYANAYIDDTTDVLVVSDGSLQRLQEGLTDGTLQQIEDTYNQSHAQTYRYVTLAESELMAWLEAPLTQSPSPAPGTPPLS